MYYLVNQAAKGQRSFYFITFFVRFFQLGLEAIFSIVLVIFALCLVKSIRKYTQKKQNTCLLFWHISNLSILIGLLFMEAYYYHKTFFVDTEHNIRFMYDYYTIVVELVHACFDIYVDLFLLWLLYRFIRPQPIVKDDKTGASTLLLSYAHGSKIVDDSSTEWYQGKQSNALLIYMLKILTEGL